MQTIGAAERSRPFFELRWLVNQEAVSGAIQVYATLASDAGTGHIGSKKGRDNFRVGNETGGTGVHEVNKKTLIRQNAR